MVCTLVFLYCIVITIRYDYTMSILKVFTFENYWGRKKVRRLYYDIEFVKSGIVDSCGVVVRMCCNNRRGVLV